MELGKNMRQTFNPHKNVETQTKERLRDPMCKKVLKIKMDEEGFKAKKSCFLGSGQALSVFFSTDHNSMLVSFIQFDLKPMWKLRLKSVMNERTGRAGRRVVPCKLGPRTRDAAAA